MKPKKKKKLDIKAFFVLHVEKIILIMVVPLAIYFAYQGTQHEPLKWQPDALAKAADESNQFILNNEHKAVDEGISIFTYDTYADWIKKEIKVDLYRTDVQWLPSLFPEKNKRGSVPVYTVTDLKATSGLGAISINPTSAAAVIAGVSATATGGGASTTQTASNQIGARWAVITGLIPIKKQLEVYVDTYSSSVLPDPVRDMPTYVYYEIERAEIEPGKGPNDLEWVRLELIKEYNINRNLWSGVGADVVDPNYLAPPVVIPMAYPLPPVAKKFGEEVAHPPVIPMLTDSQTDLLQQMEKYQQRLLERMFEVDENAVLKQNPFGGRSAGPGDSGSGSTLGTGPQLTQEEAEEIIKPVEVTHYLFRYLDFKVEPGKTYRYRARLYLANPNYDLAPNFIEEEALAKELNIATDFSDPSNMVTIPLESRILVTGVTAATTSWGDPTTSVTAIYFDMKNGAEWYVEREMAYRGTTVNFKRQEATNAALATAPQVDQSSETTSSQSRGSRRTTQKKPAEVKEDPSKKNIDIVSEVTILDMIGGVRLQKINSPAARDIPELRSVGKVVVLEPSGNLVIRNVNTDTIEMGNIKDPKMAVVVGGGAYVGP